MPDKKDSKKKSLKTPSKESGSLRTNSKDGSLKTKSKENGLKVKSKDNSLRTKSNEGSLKTKSKEESLKTKSKEGSLKTKSKEGSLKTKSKEGSLKVKSKEKSLKTKSKDGSLRVKSRELKDKVKKYSGFAALGKSIGFPSRRSPSLESTQSSGVPGTKQVSLEESIALTPEGGMPPELLGESAYDCCVFLIYCLKHEKIAISRGDKRNACWFPFVVVKTGDTWYSSAIGGSSFIIGHGDIKSISMQSGGLPFFTPEIIHILRMQVPGSPKYISRVVYAVRINNDIDFNCCKKDKRIVWINRDEVSSGNIDKLWGPEPFMWAEFASKEEINKKSVDEYSLDEAMRFAPRDPPRNKEEELMKTGGFSERDITRLYMEFLTHCFPSHYMSSTSFTIFMIKFGWSNTENKLFSIFKAFNYRNSGYLTFHELVLGLGAMDMATKHGGHPGELRCGYIFRYYDSDNDGLLDYSDIQRMTADIFAGKQIEANETTVEKDATYRMEEALKMSKTDKVQFPQFMTAISNMTFRGTSVLFRSPISVLNILSQRLVSTLDLTGDIPASVAKRQYRGTCQACKAKSFRIAVYSLRVDFTGRIIEPKSMVKTEGSDINWSTDDPITEQLRTFSRETLFNPKSLPNITILSILRQFDAIHKQRIAASFPDIKSWGKTDRNYILTAVQSLCKKAEEIFSSEPRCVKLSSPVIVLGDTHGNIADVMVYERNLWRFSASITPCNFLFLGDYVDRGEHGVEVACYLFAMKILASDTFYLCRGNHEIRSIQKCYTFLKECSIKYGTRVGPQVFESCNKAFDRMPVCAIIDDSIFGAHGGIPTSIMKIEDLMKIPSPLQEPENECPAAWEMMWSDPMNAGEFNDLAEFMKVKTSNIHGFLSNTKRGTAFFYTEEALENFLQINGLQYVLRGHEVMPLGYKFHLNGKVITVFSSSRYCGGTNEAAAIFCDNDELRVLRFETQGNL